MLQVTESPIGPLFIEASPAGIRQISFEPPTPTTSGREDASSQMMIDAAALQIDEYFKGERKTFDLPFDFANGTPFQKNVWQTIASIPFGETLSYADVAMISGAPNAYRAAGSACGQNPIVILIPCHRVVGSDGSLHGFGGGLDVKAWLLRHEGTLDRFSTSTRVRRTGRQAVLV